MKFTSYFQKQIVEMSAVYKSTKFGLLEIETRHTYMRSDFQTCGFILYVDDILHVFSTPGIYESRWETMCTNECDIVL